MTFLSYSQAVGLSSFEQVRSPDAFIHHSAKIGVRTIVSPGCWIGPGVTVGSDCYLAPNVVIGAPGFGYEQDDDSGEWTFREHPFGVQIGRKVSIGANTVIDRGRHRDTMVGAGTKIDAHCFIAHNVVVGEHCLIIANSMIAGSCVIGHGCWIGPSAQITDHVVVGRKARVGLGSVVLKDVPEGALVVGNPAKLLRYVESSSVTSHTREVEV